MDENDGMISDSSVECGDIPPEVTDISLVEQGSEHSNSSPARQRGRRPFRRNMKRKHKLMKPDAHVVVKRSVLVDRFWPAQGKLPLPEGWICTHHIGGMFVYMHLETRVVTLAPPYVLSHNTSLRKHNVPIYAIPCYMYRHVMQQEEQMKMCPVANTTPKPCSANEQSSEPTKTPSPPPGTLTPTPAAPASTADDDDLMSLFASDEPPCKRVKEEEEEVPSSEPTTITSMDEIPNSEATTSTPPIDSSLVIPNAAVLTTNDTISYGDLRKYFQTAFEYKEVEVHKFGSVSARNEHFREKKMANTAKLAKTSLSDTDVIRFQMTSGTNAKGEPIYKDCVIRVANKTYLAILHEYSIAISKKAATFNFCEQMTNESTPFRCELFISDMMYGVGEGNTKKVAKALSARSALHNLIRDFHKLEPQIKDYDVLKQSIQAADGTFSSTFATNKANRCPVTKSFENASLVDDMKEISELSQSTSQISEVANTESEHSFVDPPLDDPKGPEGESTTGNETTPKWDEEFFDKLEICSPQSFEYLTRANLPQPRILLLECLKRNFIPVSELKEESFPVKGRKDKRKFIMRLRQYTAEVFCFRNRDGRQLACQKLLTQMYPTFRYWGPVLRLFGPGSLPENKTDLTEIQKLQMREKGSVKLSLIGMLKAKMLQLADQWESMPEYGKGKFGLFNGPIPSIILHPDAQALEAQLNNATIDLGK